MTSTDGSIPINRGINVGEVVYEGTVLRVSGSVLATALTSGQMPVAIADDALVDNEGDARVARSGENIAVHFLGSGHVVRVRSEAGTYSLGEEVYSNCDTDGCCFPDDTLGPYYRIGTCAEPAGVVVGTAGGLVTVILDNHINQQKDTA